MQDTGVLVVEGLRIAMSVAKETASWAPQVKRRTQPQPELSVSQGMDQHDRHPWVPFFTICMNLILTMDVDPFECGGLMHSSRCRFRLPDSAIELSVLCGGSRLAVLFSCFVLLLQTLWKLPAQPSVLYDCCLTSLFLFVVPVCAILPWRLQKVFLCIVKSWTSWHALMLAISLFVVVVTHYGRGRQRERIEFAKEPMRPAETSLPAPVEQNSRPAQRKAPCAMSPLKCVAQTPRKLASDSKQRWDPHGIARFIDEGLAALEESRRSSLPAVTSTPQQSLSDIQFTDAEKDPRTLAVAARESVVDFSAEQAQLFTCYHNRSSLKKPPSSAAHGHDDLPAEAFWKDHSLWGKSVTDTKKIEFDDDEFSTTHKPYSGDDTVHKKQESIQSWLKDSLLHFDLEKQLVFCRIKNKNEEKAQGIRHAADTLFMSKRTNNFYWLLLRLVHASSELKDPEQSWWYQKSNGVSDDAPDNFCVVLNESQKFYGGERKENLPWLFDKYNDYILLIHRYVRGLKLLANQRLEKKEECLDMLKRLHWVKSRPHLGLRDFDISGYLLSNNELLSREADSMCIGNPKVAKYTEDKSFKWPKARVGTSSN